LSLEKVYYQFIDEYLGKTNLTYSIIYLYALRFATDGKRVPKMSVMADNLHLIPSDVHSAWLFWVSKGLARIDGDEIELNIFDKEKVVRLSASGRDRRFAALASSVSAELGGDLSAADMDTLKYIYENVALPPHVITLLVQYVHRDKGRKSMNYIEKVAIDWVEREINTIARAEEYITNAREGAKLRAERAAKREVSAVSEYKRGKIANFEPRTKTEVDPLEDYWFEQLIRQAESSSG